MHARDQIDIVEAAYAIGDPHPQWQRRLTELVASQWDGEAGSLVFDASDPGRIVRESVMVVGSDTKRATFEAGLSAPVPAEVVSVLFRTGPHLTSLYEIVGPSPEQSREFAGVREASPDLEVDHFSHGVRTLDPSHRGLFFALSARPITDRMREVWAQLATHIGIAYRLRRELARATDSSGADPQIREAVVDVEGRCHHAEGPAQSTEAREILREAARSVIRARSSLRKRDPDEALDIWRGLVSGRWSLVDRFDSDGKHFLVAHKNPPQVRDHRALTAREAQVADYLAMGLANKLIGYSLGLSTSAVADHIAAIRRKLKVSSRAELVRLLAAFDVAD